MRKYLGFTLMELLVVVAILGVLAGLVSPVIIGYLNEAKVAKLESDMASYKTAMVAGIIDTNYAYTSIVWYLHKKKADAPAGWQTNWHGPYVEETYPWNGIGTYKIYVTTEDGWIQLYSYDPYKAKAYIYKKVYPTS